ncbi:cyclin-C-like [Paramacrobiotus metropolitanus]|uniref:cyclin-C-like n=1 Tax=Paramacrobiotus metropolitanus TaxID=2943436 RepID=UPI002445AD86|nr:cyclin-C-like [Paramacrobiotus metropolitanus]
MAGNFWLSSHFQQWLFDRQDLIRERQVDYQTLSEDEYQKIMIFYANVIQAIGEQLKIKQQVIATATVYFRRFYVRNSLKTIDPLLLAPTCLYLASKVEEFGVISNSRFVNVCQGIVKNKFGYAFTQEFPYRINNIFECEFYLLEMMDCCLIVFHPYRPLAQFCQDLGASMDKKDPALQDSIFNLAWKTVNDTLRTDLCLLYPPYLIALGCISIACITLQKDFKQWFAELAVDVDKIQEVVRHIMNLYELWKSFDEKKEIPVLLSKVPKPKSPPR